MTPEAQRVAIAKAAGWNPVDDGMTGRPPGMTDEEYSKTGNVPIPDYLHDLNAMHDAENWISSTGSGYIDRLFVSNLRMAIGQNPDLACDKRQIFELLHTTAAQRAETLLRTLELWVDSPVELGREKLLPCPFCGLMPAVKVFGKNGEHIHCETPCCLQPEVFSLDETYSREKWNCRKFPVDLIHDPKNQT